MCLKDPSPTRTGFADGVAARQDPNAEKVNVKTVANRGTLEISGQADSRAMGTKRISLHAWQPHVVAITAVAAAAALRVWPLQVLGVRLAWITFYPAVMVAALCGGPHAALLGTFLSCLAVLFGLPLLVHQPLIRDSTDWLGLGFFFATCTIIAGISVVSRRAQARENQAMAERDRFFALSLDLLCVAGFDGYFKRLNPAWEKVTGWTTQELRSKPFLQFVHPHDREATIRESRKQMSGEPVLSFRNRYRCQDGSYRWLSWKSIPAEKESLMYAVARDITGHIHKEEEMQALNEALRRRSAELEASNKELEAFTYSVSHDLRAPLRHIDGFSRLLMETHGSELSEEALDYITTIRDSTREMSQLVDDLLNLARIGRRELSLQVAGLTTLVDAVASNLKAANPGRAIEWKVGPLPFVECDPSLMKQVFLNLLSNAVKFTRHRQPAVIEVGSFEQDNQPVVYVCDNGAGFDMKYSDKLFGVFQRLHRQEDFEGTGIGLAIVARVIQKHGGNVWAEGELNKGAAFYFTVGKTNGTDSKHSTEGVAHAGERENSFGGR